MVLQALQRVKRDKLQVKFQYAMWGMHGNLRTQNFTDFGPKPSKVRRTCRLGPTWPTVRPTVGPCGATRWSTWARRTHRTSLVMRETRLKAGRGE